MDPELKAYLEAMEQRLATKADLAEMRREMATKADLDETRRHLENRIDMQGRELRQDLADIRHRIDEGFAARKQDEDLALREIRTVKARVTSLERRVKLLESTKQ